MPDEGIMNQPNQRVKGERKLTVMAWKLPSLLKR